MYSMARSGMLPRWFGVLHPRFRTPVNALLFIGALSFIAPFFGTQMLGWLVDSGAPSIVLAYILVALVYLPFMPAALTPPPWILFGLWWVLGLFFLFRIPTGIAPGADAEEELLARSARART